MSGVDLLGNELRSFEEQELHIYSGLKVLLDDPELPPSARANTRVALGAVWQVVNDLDLEFEFIYDLGV